MTAPQLAMKDLRRVVIAAAVGNVIEWYDCYIFGSLASLLSVKFFAAGAAGSALIKTVGTFTAGFLIRPFGAFVFGRVGDIVGRKYTFLITLSGMGLATALIGLVPSYAQIGAAAGIILLFLRLIQGLCLGGEYGGAITYVAEHAPDHKRGYYTGWLQTSPTLGIVLSLVVIIVTRQVLGTEAFNAWGWRIPFLLSLLMVAIAIYIRLQLQETPIFQAIKAKGQTSANPWREAFWSQNIRYVLIASVVVIGEGVVWYSGQFWALYFIQQVQKPDVLHPAMITGAALLLATPSLILFGWLSDKIGRKPIILAGFLLAAVTYFPIFKGITHFANPKLEAALASSPVTVTADPSECSFQFKATGTEKFTTGCDIAKSALVNLSVNYTNQDAPKGTPAQVKIGEQTLTATSPDFAKTLPAAIKAHGYPASADPNEINTVMTTVLLWILVIYVTLVYAPIAAWLVELFPSRIRYSSMSLPYHIGNGWFGGFLPATVFAIVAATGNIYSGLWYPVGVAVMSLVIGFLFLPETKDVDITADH